MFKSKPKKLTPLRIDTLIGAAATIKGDILFQGGLHVDGVILGNVRAEAGADASLSVSDGGRIEGLVEVPNVILHGKVLGDVHANQRLELGGSAQVTGTVHYGMIEMSLGAQIIGKLVPLNAKSGVSASSVAVALSVIEPVAAEPAKAS